MFTAAPDEKLRTGKAIPFIKNLEKAILSDEIMPFYRESIVGSDYAVAMVLLGIGIIFVICADVAWNNRCSVRKPCPNALGCRHKE